MDYSTPTGRLVTQILLSVGEMEREKLSLRTKAGLVAAKGFAAGLASGGGAYGLFLAARSAK